MAWDCTHVNMQPLQCPYAVSDSSLCTVPLLWPRRFTLASATDEAFAVEITARTGGYVDQSQLLSVYLLSSPTVPPGPGATACATNVSPTLSGQTVRVLCLPPTIGAQYLFIQRMGTTANYLSLSGVKVIRTGEIRVDVGACCV